MVQVRTPYFVISLVLAIIFLTCIKSVFAADTNPPIVTYVSPANNYIGSVNQFACNITDDIALSNITIYVWNSTRILIYNTTSTLTGNSSANTWSVTLPNEQSYTWTCLGYDNSSNPSPPGNYSFIYDVTPPSVSGLYPNQSNNNFNTSQTIQIGANVNDSASGVSSVLANITYPDGTKNLLTLNFVSGTLFSNSFAIPNIAGTYSITIFANDSANYLNGTSTTSFTASDVTPPNIFNILNNSINDSSATISWSTDESSNTQLCYGRNSGLSWNTSCSETTTSNSNQNSVTSHSIVLSLDADTQYYYFVRSCDSSSNCNTSIQYTFITSNSSSQNIVNNNVNNNNLSTNNPWISTILLDDKNLDQKGLINEQLLPQYRIQIKVANLTYFVGLVSLTSTQAMLNISTYPVQVLFNVNNTKKFDLNSDNYYDISITLNGIYNNRANITLLYLHESTSGLQTSATENLTSENKTSTGVGSILSNLSKHETSIIITFCAIIVIIIILIVYIYYSMKKKKSVLNQNSKNVNKPVVKKT